jgi:hypothetical protein
MLRGEDPEPCAARIILHAAGLEQNPNLPCHDPKTKASFFTCNETE